MPITGQMPPVILTLGPSARGDCEMKKSRSYDASVLSAISVFHGVASGLIDRCEKHGEVDMVRAVIAAQTLIVDAMEKKLLSSNGED
jgi:hypothetical protein